MNGKTIESLKQSFRNMNKAARSRVERNRAIDQGLDRHVGRFSRIVWPFRRMWLLVVVGSLFVLDYTSTFFAMQNADVSEDGPLAGWALRTGGFGLLFLVDIVAAVVCVFIAVTARYLYRKSGFPGYGRAAFVFLLIPYVIRTTIVVINNFILVFR
jgi:hypothetical protein